MLRNSLLTFAFVIVSHLLFSSMALALDVQVQGLLRDTAILLIDGKQRLLKVGKRSPEGVLLIEADAKQAVIEIDGEHHQLTLSRQITSLYTQVDKREVSIRRNERNQYITTAKINGKRLQVLVDTGANAVAMSSVTAKSLGIDYEGSPQGMVRTASGEVSSYMIKLRSLDVGGIEVTAISAFVIEGNYPQMVLLGMSYLEHVSLREQSGILYLQAKF